MLAVGLRYLLHSKVIVKKLSDETLTMWAIPCDVCPRTLTEFRKKKKLHICIQAKHLRKVLRRYGLSKKRHQLRNAAQ